MDAPPGLMARLFSFRIGTRLALGFAVLLVMIVGLGIEASRDINETAKSTRMLYQHPFSVTRSLATARYDLFVLLDQLHDATAETGAKPLDVTGKAKVLAEIPLCQRSCRPDRIMAPGGAERRTWHDTDRSSKTGR
jgi:hypothetical protein